MKICNYIKTKLQSMIFLLIIMFAMSASPTVLAFGIENNSDIQNNTSFEEMSQASPKTPKLLNMTFNGDPKTSRAFDWYTKKEITGTVLQVVESSKVINGNFPKEGVYNFNGNVSIVNTFMNKSDRDKKRYTKFASHKVIANNLTPGTKYSYRAGNGDADGWSEIGTFTTDAPNNQDFHFVVGSDSQGSSKEPFDLWKDTFAKSINTANPKFFILTGDLVDNGDLEEQWQWFLGTPQKEFANCPIVPVLGGHEVKDYDDDETTENENFYNHFNLPKNVGIGGKTHTGSVYAFEYGNALFMQLNSQFAGEVDDNGNIIKDDPEFRAQLDWMRNQVAKSDKKWKFVSFHKGPYSVGDNATLWEGNRMKFYRKYLIPVFDELGIDVAFVAHDHMYMRSYQMLNDTPLKNYGKYDVTNPKGTVYLMTNSVGNKFYTRTTEDEDGNPIPKDKLPVDYFSWIDTQPYKKMFVDVSVEENTLKLTSYTAAKDENAKVYDHYTITRNDSKPKNVEAAKCILSGNKVTISWKSLSDIAEPVRGFRIYEKNEKIKANWSSYIPAVKGQTDYSYIVNGIDPGKQYGFVIKAVGDRDNSEPTYVSSK
ncbi:fibronectin type III domain-containing protein [Clostridium beijerinckii]|uniref:Fibronectin type-III domain-containing protein n=1 Tax=Clostridium beijerinckii TaxID=1520 RepID=A0AAW3W5A0_CLOBE|nr:fibronectin type III domain-containing protein [Clostridium beijerinckii]MBC2456291.1 hypothetical protein [Clostridium beijerinckii]MBC2474105.1 hypothetical protein [Clostridium beijerinckii]MDG5853269.1 metallophosphoesterase [Clostridium beijerinckii]NOV62096.1 hypothetical protein [Clostridium beijerinckii]NOV68408.1 hypothetical protein [Clostridium beijerinckii]